MTTFRANHIGRLVGLLVAATTGCIAGGESDEEYDIEASSLQDGPIAFEAARDIAGGAVKGVSALDAADIDGDGLVDIGVFEGGKHAGGRVTFAWYEAPSDPTTGQWIRRNLTKPPNLKPFIGAAKLADIDGDGDPDLVVATDNHSTSTNSAYVYWLENPRPAQSPTQAWTVRQIKGNIGVEHINDMAVAHMDGDAKVDVVIRNKDPNQIRIYFQNSKTSWTEKVIGTASFGEEGLAIGKIDGDGRNDISLNGYWLRAPTDPRTQAYATHTIDSQYSNINPNTKEAIGDIDGDGRLDVIISAAEGFYGGANHVLAWYRAPSNPTTSSAWQRTVLAQSFNGGHTVQLEDMDDDGDLDVISGVAWNSWGQTKAVKIYFNQGGGQFGSPQTVTTGKGLYSGVVRDLEGDGDFDIIGQDHYSNTSKPYIYVSLEADDGPGDPGGGGSGGAGGDPGGGDDNPFAVAIPVPGTFEAEDFYPLHFGDTDSGNASGLYRTDTDVDVWNIGQTGFKLGRVKNGEYVSWLLQVSQTGTYDVILHVANPGHPGSIGLGVDLQSVKPPIPVPNTGGWDNFTTIQFTNVSLTAGQRWLSLYMHTTGSYVGDVDKITLVKK